MILDSILNADRYKNFGRVYEALSFLQKNDFTNVAPGRYSLDGDDLYYMVQEYETEMERESAEAHKKYIDIQLLISGEEVIEWAPLEIEKEVIEENPEKDYTFFKCNAQRQIFKNGQFMIFYPEDIHKPCVAVKNPTKCKKVVVKIKL